MKSAPHFWITGMRAERFVKVVASLSPMQYL
jgi:hypothetical protein